MSLATAISGCSSAPLTNRLRRRSAICFPQHFHRRDLKTGHPIVAPEHKPGTGKMADFCPSLWGGKDWPPVAYSPKTKLLYIPANEEFLQRNSRSSRHLYPGPTVQWRDELALFAQGCRSHR